jgi:hypothetical protein
MQNLKTNFRKAHAKKDQFSTKKNMLEAEPGAKTFFLPESFDRQDTNIFFRKRLVMKK